jgi:DNA (cytosine-5)-methyltransferase 1
MQSGWSGLFAIEKDKFAFESLSYNLLFPNPVNLGFQWPDWLSKEPHSVQELGTVYATRLQSLSGKVDLLAGGPPCQGFSTAGRRDPADPRNKLVLEYLNVVKIVRPNVVLIENVSGIRMNFTDSTSETGKMNYLDWIVSELSNDYDVKAELLHLSDFGVPQRRKRFFIIAFRRGLSKGNCDIFQHIRNSTSQFLAKKRLPLSPTSSSEAISDLEVRTNGTKPSLESSGFLETLYSGPLTPYQRLMNAPGIKNPTNLRLARHSSPIISRFTEIQRICHAEGQLNTSISSTLRHRFGTKKMALRVADPNTPAPTVTSLPDDLLHYCEPRTLTVRENAHLQGFPDWFDFRGKYTTGGELRRKEVPRFTQVANAVPPLAAEAIGSSLIDFYRELLLAQGRQIGIQVLEEVKVVQ